MLTAVVDAECVLHFALRLMSGKGEVPTGTAVSFAQTPFFAELTCHGGTLFDGVENTPVFGEHIDPGHLHIFVETHGGADFIHGMSQGVFFENVTGHIDAVFLAPCTDRTGECLYKKISQDGVEAVTCGGNFFHGSKENFGEIIGNIFLITFFVNCRNGIGPCQTVLRTGVPETGFIAENGFDGLAEFVADFLAIGFVGCLHEFFHGCRIQSIEISFAVEPGAAGGKNPGKTQQFSAAARGEVFRIVDFAYLTEDRLIFIAGDSGCEPGEGIAACLGILHFFQNFIYKEAHFVFIVSGDDRTGAAGRPSVFIVKIGDQAQLFCFIDASMNTIEPFFTQIGCIQTDSGVHKETAESHFLENTNLSDQFLRIQFCVPCPERGTMELRTRIFIIFQHVFHDMNVVPFSQ